MNTVNLDHATSRPTPGGEVMKMNAPGWGGGAPPGGGGGPSDGFGPPPGGSGGPPPNPYSGPPPGGGGPMGGGGGGYQPPASPSGPFLVIKGIIIAALVVFLVQATMTLISPLMVYLFKGDPEKLLLAASIGTGVCVCTLLLDLAAGFLYAFVHKGTAPVDLGRGAAGGAISAAVARIGSGLVNLIIAVAVTPLILGDTPEAAGAQAIGGGIGGMFSICIYMFVGAALGAIGGLIGGAVFNKK